MRYDDNHVNGSGPLSAAPPPAVADRSPAAATPEAIPGSEGRISPSTAASGERQRLYRARLDRRDKLATRMAKEALKAAPEPPAERPNLQSLGAAPGVEVAKSTIAERREASRGRKMLRFPVSLLRSAFPPKSFGLRADCTDTQLLDAVDQSWAASRGFTISGAAGLPGDDGTDHCASPRRITVALPGPVPAEDLAAFWAAYDEAAFQLPVDATQVHYDACADQAWHEVFGPPVDLSQREQVWALTPTWCWVDERFCAAFTPLFEALPEICTTQQIADVLDQAWEDSQGDQWQ